ncbi:hypothetical protein WICPIJ_006544 [Wickerhamomyces pijperi]|uniref:Acyl-protein thioesterase 1 n=1 Tax=Wickerhamomyces pijperi TaxID=599730 RepID=A0A9P8Q4A2_WICPI|nr:hypothetical protein WICPIJ_006544 [Wickerhamomyces pijperi]
MSAISALRIPSRTVKPTASIIFIHGLGDTGHGWKFLSDLARRSSEFDHINFIFPNAPVVPVAVNNNYEMPSWFNIYQFGGAGTKHDFEGYLKSVDVAKQLIKEQIDNGVSPERIILGGFSQGGAVSLGALTTLDFKIGGFIPLSAPIVQFLELISDPVRYNSINLETPVFHGQGLSDPIVNNESGDKGSAFFKEKLGYKKYHYETYPGLDHSVNNEELG